MKKWILLFVVVLCGLSAFAQTGSEIQVKFTPSTSVTAVKHDVWGASGACPATGIPTGANLLGSVLVSATPNNVYDYFLGTPGQVNCLYVIARDSAGNSSVASNTAQATFPFPTLAPPTNVTATPK